MTSFGSSWDWEESSSQSVEPGVAAAPAVQPSAARQAIQPSQTQPAVTRALPQQSMPQPPQGYNGAGGYRPAVAPSNEPTQYVPTQQPPQMYQQGPQGGHGVLNQQAQSTGVLGGGNNYLFQPPQHSGPGRGPLDAQPPMARQGGQGGQAPFVQQRPGVAQSGSASRGGRGRGPKPGTWRAKRQDKYDARIREREARWARNRLSVPYRTDGPRLTFSAIWFGLIMVAAITSPFYVAVLASFAAALAALQTTNAWLPGLNSARMSAAVAAFAGGIVGFMGPVGVFVGLVIAIVAAVLFSFGVPVERYSPSQVIDVMSRSIVPAGLAAAAIAAIGTIEVSALISMLALVSAYEAGDYLIGSGANNAFEGPISGVVGLVGVAFILWIVGPSPFTPQAVILISALTAIAAPLGQIAASAMLPHGSAWAPALRRLDSYLVVAPIWLLVLLVTPPA